MLGTSRERVFLVLATFFGAARFLLERIRILMVAPAAVPSLFGRITAVQREHTHLGDTLGRLRVMCAAIESNAALPPEVDPPELTEELFAELVEHFRSEESDAYFGAMVLERPDLLPAISELRAEHEAMLEAAAELRILAGSGRTWPDLITRARSLIALLRSHEQAEAKLMQEFLLSSG